MPRNWAQMASVFVSGSLTRGLVSKAPASRECRMWLPLWLSDVHSWDGARCLPTASWRAPGGHLLVGVRRGPWVSQRLLESPRRPLCAHWAVAWLGRGGCSVTWGDTGPPTRGVRLSHGRERATDPHTRGPSRRPELLCGPRKGPAGRQPAGVGALEAGRGPGIACCGRTRGNMGPGSCPRGCGISEGGEQWPDWD